LKTSGLANQISTTLTTVPPNAKNHDQKSNFIGQTQTNNKLQL